MFKCSVSAIMMMLTHSCTLLLLATPALAAYEHVEVEDIPHGLYMYGMRPTLAFIGIFFVITGVWYVDRAWDELGSAAYKRIQKKAQKGEEFFEINIPKEDLDKAFPFPAVFLLGWAIVAISFLFEPSLEKDFGEVDISAPSMVGLVLSLALGVIASVPMGDAVRNRLPDKKKKLGMMFVLSWVVLAIFSGFDSDMDVKNGGVALVCCLLGAVFIVASMKILWKHRKMGDSWEQNGAPNPNPIVYNLGPLFFVWGFFLFWVGSTSTTTWTGTACDVDGVRCGLPIFFNARTCFAFFGGCGMPLIVRFLDYAHDEGGEYVGFGTDGKNFGRFLETPIPFILLWLIYGFAGFWTLDNKVDLHDEPRTWVVSVLCFLLAIDAGVLIQTALYEGNMSRKNKFSVPFVLMFLVLGVNLGFTADYSEMSGNGWGLPLGLVGAMMVIAGQKTVFGDRKRGDHFMQNDGEVNPNPVVYSWGEPLFMTGWIMLSLAMSLAY